MVEEGTALFWGQVILLWKRSRLSEVVIFPGPHSVYDIVQGVVPLEWASILHGCNLSAKQAWAVVRKSFLYQLLMIGSGDLSVRHRSCMSRVL